MNYPRPVPRATFNPSMGDRTAELDWDPGVPEPVGGYLPAWLLNDRRIPRPIAEARDAEAEARELAIAAAKAVAAARRAAQAADSEDARTAARDGVSVDLQAQAARSAEISGLAEAHRAAGWAHKRALQALIDAWEAHHDRLQELAVTICTRAHADVVKAAAALESALIAREGAYARIGRPGADKFGVRPDAPDAPAGNIYWGLRRNGNLLGDGFDSRLASVREVALGFPTEEVEIAR